MNKIETERKILNDLINKHGLKHDKVLQQSNKLDKLIVEETKRINNIK